VFIYIGIPSTLIRFPLKPPTFSSIPRHSPFIIKLPGILPLILAFISEHTLSRKGRMEERGAIGAIFSVDLKAFLLGRTTSISVERLMI
jgi:hypothetical protein